MSKIDERFIDNLQTFTSALDNLVKILKEQSKDKKSDVVNTMLGNIPNELKTVVENQEKILSDTKVIKSNTKKILDIVKDTRKAKEGGMFEKIQDGGNKRKIVDGIKVVILIAAGVLAVGMAFKLIGKVDFMSVVALSISMLLVAKAYKEISEIKGLTVKKALITTGVMILMAAGIWGAGLILQFMPEIGLLQSISILLISASIGIATWLIMKGIDNINIRKDWLTLLALPIILPAVALGIFLSSFFLAKIEPITLTQALAVGMIGIAIGVATFAISLALIPLRRVRWKELLMLPLLIPLVAGGIVLASFIFQYMQPLKDPEGLLKDSAYIGLTLLIFTPTIFILGKFMKPTQLLMGVAAVPLIGLAILATAWIFKLLPEEMKYPSLDWAIGTGVSMLILMPTILVMGLVASTGAGAVVVGLGLLALPLIAASMVAVSWILGEGKWEKYPPLKWALGVGGSLLLFGLASIIAAPAAFASKVTEFFVGDDPLVKLAKSMVAVSEVIDSGNWDGNYPSLEWSLGVGGGLAAFGIGTILAAPAAFASAITKFFTGEDPLVKLAKSMVLVAQEIDKGNWTENYPSIGWVAGVGGGLAAFGIGTVLAAPAAFASSITKFFTGDDPLVKLAKSMVLVAQEIDKGNWDQKKFPSEKYSKGVGTLLTIMAKTFKEINKFGLSDVLKSFFGSSSKVDFNLFVKNSAQAIADASKILEKGSYSTIPDSSYVSSFTTFITDMGEMVNDFDVDLDEMNSFSYFLTSVVPKFKHLSNFPNLDTFDQNFGKFLTVINKIPKDKHEEIENLAESITKLSKALNSVNISSMDKLAGLSTGVMLVSIVDEEKLQLVLDKISDKKDELKTIYGENDEGSLIDSAYNTLTGWFSDETEEEKVATTAVKDALTTTSQVTYDMNQQNFYNNISEMKNMLSEMLENMNSPKQEGNFNK